MKTFEQIVQEYYETEDDLEYIVSRLNETEINQCVKEYATQAVNQTTEKLLEMFNDMIDLLDLKADPRFKGTATFNVQIELP